jgi:GT2 family glycosyltransferase
MMVDDSVGVVTSKVVLDSGEIHCCGVDVVGPEGWHDRPARPDEPLGRRRWITRATHPMEGDGGTAESEPAEVDAGIGCCMMYRRADALEVGGYDTRWSPVWFDDVDLCLKIRVLGRKVFYLPDVRVIHHFTGRREAEPWHARLKPRRLRRALMRRTGKHLPFPLRDAIERRFVVDTDMHFSKSQVLLLRRHLASWQEKWGWDARNPDMAEVQRRWGDTEVCWALDPARRAAGERILAAYEPRRRELDSQFMAAV